MLWLIILEIYLFIGYLWVTKKAWRPLFGITEYLIYQMFKEDLFSSFGKDGGFKAFCIKKASPRAKAGQFFLWLFAFAIAITYFSIVGIICIIWFTFKRDGLLAMLGKALNGDDESQTETTSS